MISVSDKQRIYRRPASAYNKKSGNKSGKPPAFAEDELGCITQCPVCDKRVCDVYDPPDKPTQIKLKCPHCRKIVKIPISAQTS